MEKKMNNKGFSLVELIVVIAIMAVLVGVLAPQFIKYVEKSRESTDLTNLDSIKQVVESYFADKEGADLPETVKIAPTGTGSTFDLTFTAKGGGTYSAVTPAKVLEQGGVKGCKLKGGQWTTDPEVTWNLADNTWKYKADSKYYTTKSDQIVPE